MCHTVAGGHFGDPMTKNKRESRRRRRSGSRRSGRSFEANREGFVRSGRKKRGRTFRHDAMRLRRKKTIDFPSPKCGLRIRGIADESVNRVRLKKNER